MEEEEEDRVCSTPEQSFYASFKIYLSDSRKNSVCELDEPEIDDEISEVVSRIEKTMELSDDCTSEDDKTLSISNNDLNKITNDDTDYEEDKHDDDIIEIVTMEKIKPKFVVTDSDRFLKRSLSESDDPSIELEPRISRSKAKTHERNYESTQSVDRNGNNEKRSVFYLDPLDWIRTEGSSPLPIKEKSPSKILESVTGGLKNNLEILTESEENLNSEIEKINSKPLPPRDLAELRNHSLPNFRLTPPVPSIELTREDTSTPDQGYSSTLSFRAITPGANLVEKTRRTTFPLLCSRPGSACDKMLRKKSCISAEDIHFLQSQSRETPTQGGSISGFVRKNSKNEKLSDFGEEHIRNSMSSLFQIGRLIIAG